MRASTTRRTVRVLCGLIALAVVPLTAAADDADAWISAEGRVEATVHSWPARCGQRPDAKRWPAGARYLRRGLALLPVDDAPPVFGPGICRHFLPGPGTWQGTHRADITCGDSDGSTARVALRQPSKDVLSVVHQVRRTPGEGCAADVVGTWVLTRANAVPAEPGDTPPRAGSRRALAPIAPPVTAPPSAPIPPRTVVDVSAAVLPPPDPPVAGSRLPLFALAGLLVVLGIAGVLKGTRRAQ